MTVDVKTASVSVRLKVKDKDPMVFPCIISIRVTKENFIFQTPKIEIVALKNDIEALTVSGFITIKFEEE